MICEIRKLDFRYREKKKLESEISQLPTWPKGFLELGIDDFEAKDHKQGKYRTSPLSGLFARAKGGFYHDGRFATLNDMVDYYDNHLGTHLLKTQTRHLVE